MNSFNLDKSDEKNNLFLTEGKNDCSCLYQLCNEMGIDYNVVIQRCYHGWSADNLRYNGG